MLIIRFISSAPILIAVAILAASAALWVLFIIVKTVTWIIQSIKRVFQWKR